jgi:hypothetical protein
MIDHRMPRAIGRRVVRQTLRSYSSEWKTHFRLNETVQLACAACDRLCAMP